MADELKAINLTPREKLRFATWLNETAAADLALAETWRGNNVPEAVIDVRLAQVEASRIVAERLLILRQEDEIRMANRKTRAPRKKQLNGNSGVADGTVDWLHALRARARRRWRRSAAWRRRMRRQLPASPT